ncbi:MAG: hypothetical protein V3W37_05825 [Candidatus Binatia bacterium]
MAGSATLLGGTDIAADVNVAAGEAHIGQVGGAIAAVGDSFTPPTARQGVQFNLAELTFTDILRVSNGTAKLVKVLLTDTQGICPDLDLVILAAASDGSPGNPLSFLDNAGYVRQGVIHIRVGDWEFSQDSAIAMPSFEPFTVVGLASNRNLFGVLVTQQVVQWTASQSFRVFVSVENN